MHCKKLSPTRVLVATLPLLASASALASHDVLCVDSSQKPQTKVHLSLPEPQEVGDNPLLSSGTLQYYKKGKEVAAGEAQVSAAARATDPAQILVVYTLKKGGKNYTLKLTRAFVNNQVRATLGYWSAHGKSEIPLRCTGEIQ